MELRKNPNNPFLHEGLMLLIMEYVKAKYVPEVSKLTRAYKLREVPPIYETGNDFDGKDEVDDKQGSFEKQSISLE